MTDSAGARSTAAFRPVLRQTLRNPIHLLGTGFCSGLLRPAPGTWGSLAAWIFYLLILQWLPIWLFGVVILMGAVAGVYFCGRTAADWQVHDHDSIVWDEWIGQWIALFGLAAWPEFWLPAFLLFRLFDIWKPGPIGWADRRCSGGFGIMADDILAGLATCATLHVIIWTFHGGGVILPSG